MTRRESAHARIRDSLREEILDGRRRAGDRLPTEFELADQFGVSRHTVRVALQSLAGEGLIARHAGHGTFVTPYAADPARTRVIGDDRYIFGLTSGPPLEVIEPLTITNDPQTAMILGQHTQDVAKMSFRRVSHGNVIGHWVISLPAGVHERLAPLISSLEGGSESVISLLERTTNTIAHRADQDLTAENADPGIARLLDVEPGSALLRADRTYFDADDRPLEHVVVHYVPEHFSYRLHVVRSSSARPEPSQPRPATTTPN